MKYFFKEAFVETHNEKFQYLKEKGGTFLFVITKASNEIFFKEAFVETHDGKFMLVNIL
jgi:hypothetical protein